MALLDRHSEQVKLLAVWNAIATTEGPSSSGDYPCTNSTIVDFTGLDHEEVAEILEQLWKGGRIEAILALGGVAPHLRGIRRVLRGRPRVWGLEGWYKAHP